jgi:hypothetical protein
LTKAAGHSKREKRPQSNPSICFTTRNFCSVFFASYMILTNDDEFHGKNGEFGRSLASGVAAAAGSSSRCYPRQSANAAEISELTIQLV